MTNHRPGDESARVDRATEAYVAVDEDWRITATNDAADRLLADRDGPSGHTLWDALPAIVDTPIEYALREAMPAGEPVVDAAENKALDARIELRATPIDDGLAAFLTIDRNTGSDADRADARRRTTDRLERLTSAVSHDLRTPLTVAKGRLELARELHDDDPDLEAASEAVDRMETLIEAAVSMARAGEPVTDPEPVDLADVAGQAFDTVETAHTADATITVEASPVRADPDRLETLFEHLIRNALEHGTASASDTGAPDEPDISITVGDHPEGFHVADDGTGIPEPDRDAVVEHTFTTGDTGTGFGLAIVHEIATAHGWDVTVTESEQGGTRIEFTGVERV